ncbi:MAG: SDR family oxidoreductase [Bacteroidetes bacterium]|nr:SDR family oxidoreductase [Bacteroidota bacterium]
MSHQLLAGKRGIIFGALDEQSIAWKVALQAHSEGAKFTLTNAPVALRMGAINQLAEKTGSQVIGADVTLLPDLENLLKTSVETLGGKLDFILHSVGMSINVRKGKAYNDLDYDHMHKSMDISAMSFHRLLQSAEKLDVFNEHASVVALTYIAAQRVFPDYNEMAEAKAFLESIARSYGYHLGKNKKIRVNTISQSPTKTTAGAGIKGFGAFYNYADAISPLGNATAEDCANYCVMMFSDYTRMVTMQNLFHDGGFSNTGVSKEVMEKFA